MNLLYLLESLGSRAHRDVGQVSMSERLTQYVSAHRIVVDD